ncbi:MAG: hypothetical protein WDA71_00220 [Actinomycetota bacterium]
MGLSTAGRKAVTEEMARRYAAGSKKAKGVMLGELCSLTGWSRRHGQGGYHTTSMTRGSKAGAWHGVIPGNAVTPDGVDYFIKAGAGSTYDPRGASNRALAHAIGVAIPEVPNAVAILPLPSVKPALPATGAAGAAALVAMIMVGVAVLLRRSAHAS